MSGNFLQPLPKRSNGNFGDFGSGGSKPGKVPQSVAINETIDKLKIGESGALTATVTYSDGSVVNSADNPSVVIWNVSDDSILTISETGKYEAVAVGLANVTVSVSADNTITDIVDVTVVIDADFECILDDASNANGTVYRLNDDSYCKPDLEQAYQVDDSVRAKMFLLLNDYYSGSGAKNMRLGESTSSTGVNLHRKWRKFDALKITIMRQADFGLLVVTAQWGLNHANEYDSKDAQKVVDFIRNNVKSIYLFKIEQLIV